MSSGKRAKLASKFLRAQLATSYLIYFLMVGAVTVNMFFLSNWWAKLIPPEMYPVPAHIQNALGVTLLLALLLLQSLFLASLYLVKKERQSEDGGQPRSR
ncbi:MAG: hypothetical protein KIH01_07480 [Candidatus Freyarchaeota archaeon]|nr:hypothetical protein [Candidatus Jordarchaeia archaeon]